MKRSLIDKLCCPIDKQLLHLQVFREDDEKNIFEGVLTCQTCERYYPVIHGIPILAPDEYREKSLEIPLLRKWGLNTKEEKQFFISPPAPS